MDKPNKTGTKKPTFSRRKIVALIVPALLSLLAVVLYTPRLRISSETTRVTGPIAKNGQIDFYRYVEERNTPPGMKTEENGYRDFVRVFGDLNNYGKGCEAEDLACYRRQKYEKLGLDPNVPPSMTMPPWPDAVLTADCRARNVIESSDTFQPLWSPWTLEDLPAMTHWIRGIDEPLDRAAEMIRKPLFFQPLLVSPKNDRAGTSQRIFDCPMLEVDLLRGLSRAFQVRANYRIAKGDTDGATDDIATLFLLGEKTPPGLPIADWVSRNCTNSAISTKIADNPEHPLTKEQAKRLFDIHARLPEWPGMKEIGECIRIETLDAVNDAFHQDDYFVLWKDFEGIPLFVSTCDPNVAFSCVNQCYDDFIATKNPNDVRFPSIPASKAEAVFSMLTSSFRGQLLAKSACDSHMIYAQRVAEHSQQMECRRQMRMLFFALAMYRAEHGTLPEHDWRQAVTPYLDASPEEFFRCPCRDMTDKKGSYALIRYDKMPGDLSLPVLVEVPEADLPETAEFMLREFADLLQAYDARTDTPGVHNGTLVTVALNGGVTSQSIRYKLNEWIDRLRNGNAESGAKPSDDSER